MEDVMFYPIMDLVISGTPLTFFNLKKCGFNLSKINELIRSNILKRRFLGSYEFIDYDMLFRYAKHLDGVLLTDKANKAWEIVGDKVEDEEAKYLLVLRALDNKDYQKAIDIVGHLYVEGDDNQQRKSMIILSLLDFITNIGELKESTKKFKKTQLYINESDGQVTGINEFERSCVLGFFSRAIGELQFLTNGIEQTTYDQILFMLLKDANKEKDQIEKDVLTLLQRGDFDSAREYLSVKNERQRLVRKHKALYHLLNVLSDLEITNEVPKLIHSSDKGLYTYIRNNNFASALKEAKRFSVINGVNLKDNMMYLVLNRIVKKIYTINGRNAKKAETTDEKLHALVKNVSTPKDLDDIVNNGNLPYLEGLYLRLLFAEKCYQTGYKRLGDEEITKVEKSPNKDNKVVDKLEEVRRNKTLFINYNKSGDSIKFEPVSKKSQKY